MLVEFPPNPKKDEPPFWQRLYEFRFYLAFFFVCFVMVATLFIRQSLKSKALESDFATLISRVHVGKMDFDSKKLMALLKKHPSVYPLFDHRMMRDALKNQQFEKAEEIYKRRDKRLYFVPEVYKIFAKNSLLIEQGKIQEAILASYSLHEKLLDIKEDHIRLYLFNLLRLYNLEKSTGNSQKEKEYKSLLQKELDSDESLKEEIMSHLSDGDHQLF